LEKTIESLRDARDKGAVESAKVSEWAASLQSDLEALKSAREKENAEASRTVAKLRQELESLHATNAVEAAAKQEELAKVSAWAKDMEKTIQSLGEARARDAVESAKTAEWVANLQSNLEALKNARDKENAEALRTAAELTEHLDAERANNATLLSEVVELRRMVAGGSESMRELVSQNQLLRDDLERAKNSSRSSEDLLINERDTERKRVALLQGALENTEDSLRIAQQTGEEAHVHAEQLRTAITSYQSHIEALEADRASMRLKLDECLHERARLEHESAEGVRLTEALAERTRQLALALGGAEHINTIAREGLGVSATAFGVLRERLAEANCGLRSIGSCDDSPSERTQQLAEALAASIARAEELWNESSPTRERVVS